MNKEQQIAKLAKFLMKEHYNFTMKNKHEYWCEIAIKLIKELDNRTLTERVEKIVDDKIEREVEKAIDRKIQEMVNNVGRVGMTDFN